MHSRRVSAASICASCSMKPGSATAASSAAMEKGDGASGAPSTTQPSCRKRCGLRRPRLLSGLAPPTLASSRGATRGARLSGMRSSLSSVAPKRHETSGSESSGAPLDVARESVRSVIVSESAAGVAME